MITKMNGLLDPKMRREVDHAKASKDCSNVLIQWTNNVAAGIRAFIPDVDDQDVCYVALRISTCDVEEVKAIPGEYEEHFGKDNNCMYNQLIANSGEREKTCLPFVDMCLREWMDSFSEDMDF